MDCKNSEGKKGNTGINASKSFSSSTLPFCERSQKDNANSFGVFTASNKHQIPPSPTSEPPPILPKRYLRLAKHQLMSMNSPIMEHCCSHTLIFILSFRSASAPKSPIKPAVPPKPKHINNKSPSPRKTSQDAANTYSSNTNGKCDNNDGTNSKQFSTAPISSHSNSKKLFSHADQEKGTY